jgi:hypothetical protein
VARANPNGGGQVLIIEGSFVEGREAGQAFVLDGEQMARLTDLSGPAGGPFRFEVLLRSAAFKGGASTPKIAALRLPAALAR